MKFNSYKIIWLGLLVLLVISITCVVYYFSTKSSIYDSTKETSIPEHKKIKLPGEIISQSAEPKLPEKEYDDSITSGPDAPKQNEDLYNTDAPIAGSAIKVPDEPALPPKEEDIIKLSIENGVLSLDNINILKNQAVILKITSLDDDYIFIIEEIGISEIIKANKSMTISFRAPSKAAELNYYCQNYKTKEKLGEGKLIIK
ncbi:hypothetical protein D4R86_05820 [bacterium]|nr:MAG: hypothetical protein D4R86_05820 [bacterium]